MATFAARGTVMALLVTLAACSAADDPGVSVVASPNSTAETVTESFGPLVSDTIASLRNIASVEARRTPDGVIGSWHLLASDDGDQAPIVNVEIRPDEPAALSEPRQLDNGRTIAGRADTASVQIQMAGAEGQFVEISSRRVGVRETLGLIEEIEVSGDAITFLPDGWVEVGTVTFPTTSDAFYTSYVFADDTALSIIVERAQADRDVLAAFGPTTPVDIDTAGWAVRNDPPALPGYVFLYDAATVVSISGDLTDDEFRQVARALRPLEPGELEILPAG